MKIAACSFPVSGDIQSNLRTMRRSIQNAAQAGVQLILFPECALTGYPPKNMASAACVDFSALTKAEDELRILSEENDICIVAGSITPQIDACFNSAVIFMPGRQVRYHKRALWGWDSENFVSGSEPGIFEFGGLRIGVRICYEIRFPEYFRELYRAHTDLNLVLFHDVSDCANSDRLDIIRAHLRTRAAENVCPVLSANTAHQYGAAPTALFDASGRILAELKPGADGLLISDFSPSPPDFSERGRLQISDRLNLM